MSRWVSARIGSYPIRRRDRWDLDLSDLDLSDMDLSDVDLSDMDLSDMGVKTGLNAHAVSSACVRVTQVLQYNNGVP